MSEQLGKVEAHIESTRQLSSVVAAMRSIAAGRIREARQQLEGIRTYAQTIGAAIAETLAMAPAQPNAMAAAGGWRLRIVILFCSEQGFVGAYNDRIFDALGQLPSLAEHQSEAIFLVGDRGLAAAEQRNVPIAWSAAMAVHAGQAGELANRIANAILGRIPDLGGMEVHVLHAVAGGPAGLSIAQRRLVPFDYGRFAVVRSGERPLTSLPPQALLAKLADEYMFAELCEAVVLSFVAENEARVRAMTAASTNVDKSLEGLLGLSRQLRQEVITTEIVELAAGTLGR